MTTGGIVVTGGRLLMTYWALRGGFERRFEVALAAESIQVFSGLVSANKVNGIQRQNL